MALADWPGERLRLRARIDYLECQHQTILKDCSRLRSSVTIMQEQTIRLSDEKSSEAARWHDEATRLYEECREMRELAEERAASNSHGASLVAELREEVALAGKENDRLVASLMEAKFEAQRNAEAHDDLAGKFLGFQNAHGGFLELELEKKKHSVRRLATVLAGAERKAWRTWLRATARTRDTIQAADFAKERAQMQVTIAQSNSDALRVETEWRLKRVVNTVSASRLRKGWHTWRQKELCYVQARLKLLRARKVLGRISLATQAAAWNSWIGVVEHSREEEKAMKMLLGRMLRLKEAVGFDVWCRFFFNAREVERNAAARVAVVRKVVANVVSSTATRVLRKWRDVTNKMILELAISDEQAKMSALMAQAKTDTRRTETERRLRRFVSSVCASHLRKGWHTWRQKELVYVQARSKIRRAQKVLGAISLAAQAAAWNSWIGVVEYARDEKKAMQMLLGRILRLKQAVGFEAWKRFVVNMREVKRVAAARAAAFRKVVANVVSNTVARGLRQWRDATKSIHAALTLSKEREKLRALMLQSSSDARRNETEMRLRRVVTSACASHLRKGWHTWRQKELAFERARTKLLRARKVLGRISLATQAAALNSWIGFVENAHAAEKATRVLLGRLLRLKEAMGFDAWWQFIIKTREAERIAVARAAAVRKVVGHFMSSTIARVLRHWRDVTKLVIVDEERAMMAATMFQSTANSRRYETQLKLRRFVSSVCASHLRRGWHTWREKEITCARARTKIRRAQKVLGRVLRFKAAMGFDAWWQFIIKTREAERIAVARAAAVRKVVANVVSSTAARGFRKWRDVTNKLLLELAIAEERAKMSAIVAQSSAGARRTETERRLKRVVSAVCTSHLRKGWYAWRQKEILYAQARTKLRRARKVIGRISLATQAAALNSWIGFVEQARDEQKAITMLLGRLLRLKESMGFDEWKRFVLKTRETKRIAVARAAAVRKVVANVVSSTAARGLRHWRDVTNKLLLDLTVAEERAKMSAIMAQASAATRRTEIERRLKRVVSAVCTSHLRKGWYTWRQKELVYVQARSKLRRARKVIGRISLATQAAALNSWIKFVEHSREEEKAIKKLLGRILRLKESTGFDAWKRFVLNMREAERIAAARAAAVRKVVANVVSIAIARGLRHWRDVANKLLLVATMTQSAAASRHCETQLKLGRVVRAVSASNLRKGWYTWRQKELVYAQARTKLRRARKALGGIALAAQAAAWNSWIGVMEHARKEEKSIKKLFGRILRLKESIGFYCWKCFVLSMREAERVAKEQSKLASVVAMARRSEVQIKVRGLVSQVARMALSVDEKGKARSFLRWCRFVGSKNEAHAHRYRSVKRLLQVATSVDDKGTILSFSKWCRFAVSRREGKTLQRHAFKTIDKVLSRMLHTKLNMAFRTWEQLLRDQDLLRRAFEDRGRAAKTIIRVGLSLADTGKTVAFWRWRRFYQVRKQTELSSRALVGALRAVYCKGVSRAFTAWVRCTHFERGSAAEAALTVKVSTERSLAVMARVARHLLLHKLARGFRCWHVLANEMWAVWCVGVAAKKRRQVALMRSAVVRCRRFRLALSWAKWHSLRHQALVAFQNRVLASTGTRHRAACRRLVAVCNGPLRAAFARLGQHATGRRAKLAKVAVAAQWLEGEVARLHLRRVAAGWQRWRQELAAYGARRCGLKAALRAARRRNGRDVASGFARWACAAQAAHRTELAIARGVLQLQTLVRGVTLRRLHSRWAVWKQLHACAASAVKIHRLESRVAALLKDVDALENAAAHPEADALAALLVAAGRAALAAAWRAIGVLQSRGSAQQAQAKVVLADRKAAAFEAAAATAKPTKFIGR